MDWIVVVEQLVARGYTQMKIAELCDVSQSTISDIARGVTKSPSWALGTRLNQLLASAT